MSRRVSKPVAAPPRGDARAALLGAALTLVRRHGWSATSVDQLCRAAGVTKGAFFHHFASKEALGVAAAKHWGTVTAPLFAGAPYHQHEDPLDRVFGYLDFRAAIADGALADFTCFVGTVVQETFASSDPIRAACDDTIRAHAAHLEKDLRAAMERHPPREAVTASGLAIYTQTVIQGGFVLSKAQGSNAPLLDAISHLKRYLSLLFQHTIPTETKHVKRPR